MIKHVFLAIHVMSTGYDAPKVLKLIIKIQLNFKTCQVSVKPFNKFHPLWLTKNADLFMLLSLLSYVAVNVTEVCNHGQNDVVFLKTFFS